MKNPYLDELARKACDNPGYVNENLYGEWLPPIRANYIVKGGLSGQRAPEPRKLSLLDKLKRIFKR